MSNNNRNRRGAVQNRSFVASLSPEGQINKVIADQNNLKGGHDLRNWSASARKELTPSISILLEIDYVKVQVPKLALLAASPSFRAHIVENPKAQHLDLVHKDISSEAMKIIAKWLRNVCWEQEFPALPVPSDLGDALKLRLTAFSLGMDQYVEHIEDRYIKGVENRVPDLVEIEVVIDNTRAEYEDDPVLVALANRLSYLCRFHKVSQDREVAYAKLLAEEKYGRLVDAVQEAEVLKMAERARSAT